MPIAETASFAVQPSPDSPFFDQHGVDQHRHDRRRHDRHRLDRHSVPPVWQPVPQPLRVMILDERSFVRQWLTRQLAVDPRLIALAHESSSAELASQLESERPDLVLLSATGREELALALVTEISALDPTLPILVQGPNDVGAEGCLAFVEAGATGWLNEGCTLDELTRGIRTVASGEVLLSSRLNRLVLSRLSALARRQQELQAGFCEVLSAREIEVLKLIAGGLRNKEIGQRLYLSVHTVKNHVHNILAKLEVSNRRAAVALAHREGWLSTAYEC